MSQDRNQHMRFALEALRDSLDANNFQPLERGLGLGKVRRAFVRPTRQQLDETKAVELMSGAATSPVTQEIKVDSDFSRAPQKIQQTYSGRLGRRGRGESELSRGVVRILLSFMIDLSVITVSLLNVFLILEFASSILVGERLGLFSLLSKVQGLTPLQSARVIGALVVCYVLYRVVFRIFSTQTIGANFVASRMKKFI